MNPSPVMLFTRIVPAYRRPILERWNAALGGRLVVCSGDPPAGSSLGSLIGDGERGYREIRLDNWWWGGERIHAQRFWTAWREVDRPSAVIVEESPRTLTLPWLLSSAARRGARVALWGHFSSNRRAFRPRRHPLDAYRLWLARRVDACICYTEEIESLLAPFVPAERCFVARNTIDMETLEGLRHALESEGQQAVRHRLGLPVECPVVLYVGRLDEAKGAHLLLDVLAHLRRSAPVSLVIVGDGPLRPALERRVTEEALDNVILTGSLTDWARSAPYLFASDVMLVPGYLGLVVNHAFAFGLPVVSRRPPSGARFHSPEMAYLRDGSNAVLADSAEPSALACAVLAALKDRTRLSRNALQFARAELSPQRMVDGLLAAVRFLEQRTEQVAQSAG